MPGQQARRVREAIRGSPHQQKCRQGAPDRPHVVAVPGPELRVRAGDGLADRGAVLPAAGGGPAGRAPGAGRAGGCGGRPPVVAAGDLLAVPRARQAGCRSGADVVRARGRAGRGGRGAGGVLLRAAGGLHGRVGHGRAGQHEERRVLRPALPASPGTGRSRRPGGSRRRSPGPAACWAPRSAGTPAPGSRWPRTCWAASARACWCPRTARSCPGPPPAPSWPPARTSWGAPRRRSPSSRCRSSRTARAWRS